jgi:large subunit ribosomal protein L9
MEIILREAIETLGHAGDVVKVRDGYARNYLLPRKKAYLATPGNLRVMEQEKAKLIRREAELRGEAEKLREMLSAVEIRIERRVGEQGVLYGSVTTADIAEALDAKGYTIDKRKILIDEHIKEIGEFSVPIRLFTEVQAEIKLRVEVEGAPPAEPAPEPESGGTAAENDQSE